MHSVTFALYIEDIHPSIQDKKNNLTDKGSFEKPVAQNVNLHKVINILWITCGKPSGYYLDNLPFVHSMSFRFG